MSWKVEDLLDLTRTEFPEIFEGVSYPWEILGMIGDFLKNLSPERMKSLGYTEWKEGIWLGRNVTIEDGAMIKAPAVVGHGTEIRHNAYIRGKAVIGKNVVVGNSCEVKNAFIFDEVQIPHFNYVGDSVLGYKSHIGAGVILSNVKSIKGTVKVRSGDAIVDTGLRKFGAILGDFAEVGCNAVLNPGTVLGRNTVVYPLVSVRGTIPENSIVKAPDVIVPRR